MILIWPQVYMVPANNIITSAYNNSYTFSSGDAIPLTISTPNLGSSPGSFQAPIGFGKASTTSDTQA